MEMLSSRTTAPWAYDKHGAVYEDVPVAFLSSPLLRLALRMFRQRAVADGKSEMGGAKDAEALVEQGFQGWGPVKKYVAGPGPFFTQWIFLLTLCCPE